MTSWAVLFFVLAVDGVSHLGWGAQIARVKQTPLAMSSGYMAQVA